MTIQTVCPDKIIIINVEYRKMFNQTRNIPLFVISVCKIKTRHKQHHTQIKQATTRIRH